MNTITTIGVSPVTPGSGTSLALRVYVAAVILTGFGLLAAFGQQAVSANRSTVIALGALAVVASVFKIALPLSAGSANMTLSYAVDFAGLILVGSHATAVIAASATAVQVALKQNQFHRRLFSVASIVIAVEGAGFAFRLLDGGPDVYELSAMAQGLAGSAIVYFLLNSLLVAGAVALSSEQKFVQVWHDGFLWSAPGYFVSAAAAGSAAVLFRSGGLPRVLLPSVAVYLTYVAYKVASSRVADEQRHRREIETAHATALQALEREKRSEAALVFEKDRLAVTLRSIGDSVIATDTGGRILLMNTQAEVLTGSSDSVLHASMGDVLQLRDRDTGEPVEHPVDRVIRDGMLPLELSRTMLNRPDGSAVMIDRTGSIVRDRNGTPTGVVWVFRDVTNAVRFEAEHTRVSKLESLGVLAGGIAHDFNNILMGISGNLGLARVAAGSPEELVALLREAEAACMRAKTLTGQLLTFSKGGAPVKTTASLDELLRECARFALRGSNVVCEYAIADDLASVEGDVDQLSQVVHNLLLNAQQAMPDGGVARIEAVNVTLDEGSGVPLPPGQYVRVTVRDEGVGIDRADLSKIFDPYFTTKAGGSGLGLAACYSIVRRHGGYIAAESQVGAGAAFTVYLPAAPSAAAKALRRDARFAVRGSGRILVMEDDPEGRLLLLRMLGVLGFAAVTVSEGGAAVETYRQAMMAGEPFEAVLMDLTVPGGMGGAEAIGLLLKMDPTARSIAMSGYADSPVMAEFKKWGFVGVLPKPFTIDDLSDGLARLVGESAARPPRFVPQHTK
jgi:PAS domain S-box-containing protein